MPHKSKIIGIWRNEDIEYVFSKENNRLRIYWIKENWCSGGRYFLKEDIIVLRHGTHMTGYTDYKGQITSISDSELSILDLTEEIGKIDTVKRVNSTLLGYK